MAAPQGRSVIGDLQEEAKATAANLDQTAAGIRGFIKPLQASWDHQMAAMAHSHQADVPALGTLVATGIAALGGCADRVTQGARQIRAIEART